MIPAMLATIYVMFLYWQLNATSEPPASKTPAGTMRDEIAAINIRLADIEKKLKT